MAKNLKNEVAVDSANVKNAKKSADKKVVKKNGKVTKKENFFVRLWKKFVKLCKDTIGEMKKVVWTPKKEVKKSTKLVIVSVLAVGIIIAVIDTACSYLINTIAGLIG